MPRADMRAVRTTMWKLMFACLNAQRALRAEEIEKQEAVEIVTNYEENLPNKEISSRLTKDFSVVVCDIGRAADGVWREA